MRSGSVASGRDASAAGPAKRWGVRLAVASLACLTAVAAAGCGSGKAPGGSLTGSGRDAAQAALDRLEQTSIPRKVVAISYQSGAAPTLCSILPAAGSDGAYSLFLVWKPGRQYRSVPQSVLQATIPAAGRPVRFTVSSFGGAARIPEPASVAANLVRVSLSETAARCQVLADGRLRLAPES